MNSFNAIINIVRESIPLVQPSISALVGGFITAMFLRGNTNRVEFEKIKSGKIKEAIDDLVESRELTLTELVKCKNILKIAKLADAEYSKHCENEKSQTQNHDFDFDWFLRFFESAGSISNENMQLLWARILSGEVLKRGTFSLRTMETLRNMNYEEALLFEYCSQLRVVSPYGEIFLLCSDESFSFSENENQEFAGKFDDCIDSESDWIEILSLAYNIGHETVAVMEQCGLLSSILVTSIFPVDENSRALFNTTAAVNLILKTKYKENRLDFELKGFRFTKVATELFSIIDKNPSLMFMLDVARLIEKKHPVIDVSVYEFVEIDEDGCYCFEDGKNILHETKYVHKTQLPNLDDL